jgi:hypothetical protein
MPAVHNLFLIHVLNWKLLVVQFGASLLNQYDVHGEIVRDAFLNFQVHYLLTIHT